MMSTQCLAEVFFQQIESLHTITWALAPTNDNIGSRETSCPHTHTQKYQCATRERNMLVGEHMTWLALHALLVSLLTMRWTLIC
jgi:hypothetical protein